MHKISMLACHLVFEFLVPLRRCQLHDKFARTYIWLPERNFFVQLHSQTFVNNEQQFSDTIAVYLLRYKTKC